MKLPAKKPSPKLAALADLHSEIGNALAAKMKSKKLDHSKASVTPDTQMGIEGEAADESDPQAIRRKRHFGATGK